jgi:hypothetical protein
MQFIILSSKIPYVIQVKICLDFKRPRLQKEMEPSALALKGTVTHGSQKNA